MRFMPKSMARLRRWVRATRRWEKCFFDAARKKNGQTSVSPISSYVRIPQSGGGEGKNGAPSLIIHIAMALANASCCSASPGLPGTSGEAEGDRPSTRDDGASAATSNET